MEAREEFQKRKIEGEPISSLGGEWTQHFKRRVLHQADSKRHQRREEYAAEAIAEAGKRGEAEGMIAP